MEEWCEFEEREEGGDRLREQRMTSISCHAHIPCVENMVQVIEECFHYVCYRTVV